MDIDTLRIIFAIVGSVTFAGGLAWFGIETLRRPAPEPHVPDHVDVPPLPTWLDSLPALPNRGDEVRWDGDEA